MPAAAVRNVAELHAIAWALAETAAARYDRAAAELASERERAMEPVRTVLEYLGKREHERVAELGLRCPQAGSLVGQALREGGPSIDLVPQDELTELLNSSLTTAYQAWAIAVRSRERTFVFWTYIAAQCVEPAIKTVAEQMAREALIDGNTLRRERRLAWRAERDTATEEFGRGPGELSSAALLESLLFKEVVRWTRELPESARDPVLTAAGYSSDEAMAADLELPGSTQARTIDDTKQCAIRYAEQLASIYLDEADHAIDQSQLDLAQRLAASSIKRLARLRTVASTPRQ